MTNSPARAVDVAEALTDELMELIDEAPANDQMPLALSAAAIFVGGLIGGYARSDADREAMIAQMVEQIPGIARAAYEDTHDDNS